jgi:hypothetical protein
MIRTRSTALPSLGLWTLVALLLVTSMLSIAQPVGADVTGGCSGSVDFFMDSAGSYGPSNDTRSNPIVVPKTDGETAKWKGASPGDNRNHSGKVQVKIGPAWINVAEWGHPNEANVEANSGDYAMDDFWAVVPGGQDVVNGIYQARADHAGDGASCAATAFIRFDGDPLSSPIVLGLIAVAVVLAGLVLMIARRTRNSGLLGVAMFLAILLGLVLAGLLQQFSIWPLDNLSVFGFPAILVLLTFFLRSK